MSNQKRVSAGLPAGGQFAPQRHAEPGVIIEPSMLTSDGIMTDSHGVMWLPHPTGHVSSSNLFIESFVRPAGDGFEWETRIERYGSMSVASGSANSFDSAADGVFEAAPHALLAYHNKIASVDAERAHDDGVWANCGFDAAEQRQIWEQGLYAGVRPARRFPVETESMTAKAWRDAGFTPQRARQFNDRNMSVSLVKQWNSSGFSDRDALQWIDNGVGSPTGKGGAQDWVDNGFSDPDEVGEWIRVTALRVEQAKQWKNLGFTPRTASQWDSHGFTPNESFRAAFDFKSPEDALARWESDGVTP